MKNFDGWLWDGQSFTGPKLLSRPFLYRSDNFYRSYITNIENILRSFIGSNVSTPSFNLRNENQNAWKGKKKLQTNVRCLKKIVTIFLISFAILNNQYLMVSIEEIDPFWCRITYLQINDKMQMELIVENIFVLGGRKQFQEKEDERDVRGIGESLELDNIRKYWFHGIRTYSDFWRYPDYIQGSDCGVCCLVAVLNNCCSFHNDVSPRLFKMVRTQKTYSGTK